MIDGREASRPLQIPTHHQRVKNIHLIVCKATNFEGQNHRGRSEAAAD